MCRVQGFRVGNPKALYVARQWQSTKPALKEQILTPSTNIQ